MKKTPLEKHRRILELVSINAKKKDIIETLGVSWHTIKFTVEKTRGVNFQELSDEQLEVLLYGDKRNTVVGRRPDYAFLNGRRELEAISGYQLWKEYVAEQKAHGDKYIQYAMFSKHLSEAKRQEQEDPATLYTFWLAQCVGIVYGEVTINAKVFVGYFPYSDYVYYNIYPCSRNGEFIKAHADLFQTLKRIPRVILTLPLSIREKNDFCEFVDYYKCKHHYASKPQIDRARNKCELDYVQIGLCGKSIDEARIILRNCSHKRISRTYKEYSDIVFERFEKKYMANLPRYEYEVCESYSRKVLYNCHIQIEGKYYSVPWQYVGMSVSVHQYKEKIQIYNGHNLLAEHAVLAQGKDVYCTDEHHMPPIDNKLPVNRNSILNRALMIGPCTEVVVCNMLDLVEIEQQVYKNCMEVFALTDNSEDGDRQLELACQYVLVKNMPATISSIKKGLTEISE